MNSSLSPLFLRRSTTHARKFNCSKLIESNQRHFYFHNDYLDDFVSDDMITLNFFEIYSMSYFFSAADTDGEALARSGSQVHTFMLSLPPHFSLFELFSLNLAEICLMFAMR